MKLTYFSIRDYRSIQKAELSNLQSATVLIGPNNEGKSNVLQGLNACLTILRTERALRLGTDRLQLRYGRDSYDWAVDYPIAKQSAEKAGESVFELDFELTAAERSAFRTQTGSSLNGVLPIQLSFGPTGFAAFKVVRKGRGGVALSKKPDAICGFIAKTLDFAYIPAVRTAGASINLVNELVFRELRQLEKNPRYGELQKELEALQKPLLKTLSAKLKTNLQGFLGEGLKGVSLNLVERYKSQRFGRTCQITIDDGTPTVLERKGDGIQSLVAISLMTGALQESGADKDIILLIEEPESHLHPKAIHQLRDVLETLRQDNQLIVATHCPLLVNRANVAANFIVAKNEAAPAESLSELRQVLGVRPADNLQHAALVLLVEGSEDEIALRALLTHYSADAAKALARGSLAFQVLGGASKLPYALSLLNSFMCNHHTLLDDDSEGRNAFAESKKALLCSEAYITFTKCLGLPEAEFEDLLNESVYVEHFQKKYSVDVRYAPFNAKQKWSKRIRMGLAKTGASSATGESWPEVEEYADKHAIAQLVAANPGAALHAAREPLIKSFVAMLEAKLKTLGAKV